jgi:hypothetical protein
VDALITGYGCTITKTTAAGQLKRFGSSLPSSSIATWSHKHTSSRNRTPVRLPWRDFPAALHSQGSSQRAGRHAKQWGINTNTVPLVLAERREK